MARSPAAQDDVRENRLVDIFNLTRPEKHVRHGTDAILVVDGHTIEFELKSVTRERGSISTVRDLGPDHIAKWRHKHWIVAFFDGVTLHGCRYGSPDAMAPWITKIWNYIKSDFEIANMAPKLINLQDMYTVIGAKSSYHLSDAKQLQKMQYSSAQYKNLMDKKNGYSPERMLEIFKDRVKYVIERGSTLNNPHIPFSFFADWPEINKNHAAALRKHVRKWIASTPVQSLAQDDKP